MAADYSRIHRLLKILTLIQSGSGWTAGRLADACGTSVRTIYRDMRVLEGAGIPYYHDTQHPGYRVRRDFFLPPMQLTLDEALALIALGEHIGGREQIPLTRSAARAVSKVRSQLPHDVRDQLEKLDPHVTLNLARSGPFEGIRDVYDAMRDAITRRRTLHCTYEAATGKHKGEDDTFEFEPYTLFFNQRAWYAVGRHLGRQGGRQEGRQGGRQSSQQDSRQAERGGRNGLRSLKLNRFTSIEPTRQRYDVPDDFSLKDHLGLAWRMIRGEPRCDVELTFDADFAETIADTQWHETQQVTWRDDGSIRFRCQVDGLDEIVWWVLGMGPHCHVVKPDALASRVAELAVGVVALYRPAPHLRDAGA